MPARVNNAFDIAFYFIAKAEDNDEHLQPLKLHALLFLSQAYFSVSSTGQKLMPAVFVADERGPIEPNVYSAFANGLHDTDTSRYLKKDIEGFLNSIWQRFGSYRTDKLIKITKESKAYKIAKTRGRRAEILLEDMQPSFNSSSEMTNTQTDTKLKFYQVQTGKAVSLQKWQPRKKLDRGVQNSRIKK